MFISAQHVDVITSFSGWMNLLPTPSYSSDYVGVFAAELSSTRSLISLLHLLFSPSEGNECLLHVCTSGWDMSTCGWNDFPCVTLSRAALHSQNSSTILLSHETHLSESDTVRLLYDITIRASSESIFSSNTECIYSFGSGFPSSQHGILITSGLSKLMQFTLYIGASFYSQYELICISGGDAVLENMTVVSNDRLTLNSSLVKICSCTFNCCNVTIMNFLLRNSSLFDVDASGMAGLLFNDSVMENITRLEGNGTCFELRCERNELRLTGGKIEGCESSSGYGGGIYAAIGEGGTVEMEGITFDSCWAGMYGGAVAVSISGRESTVIFKDCAPMNVQDIIGGFVYVECEDIKMEIEKSVWERFILEHGTEGKESENWIAETKNGGQSGTIESFVRIDRKEEESEEGSQEIGDTDMSSSVQSESFDAHGEIEENIESEGIEKKGAGLTGGLLIVIAGVSLGVIAVIMVSVSICICRRFKKHKGEREEGIEMDSGLLSTERSSPQPSDMSS